MFSLENLNAAVSLLERLAVIQPELSQLLLLALLVWVIFHFLKDKKGKE